MTRKTTSKTRATKTTKAPVAAKTVTPPAETVEVAPTNTVAQKAAAPAPTTPVLSALGEKATIVVKPRQVSSQEIAVRAYEIFCSRQGHHGNPLQDWLQAERELARA